MNTDDFNYYKNTGFRNTRNRKRILILDVDDSAADASHLGSGGEFSIELFEPLIIDKQSEVYLDNFISFNGNISNTPANSAFCLKINEFNINSNIGNNLDKTAVDVTTGKKSIDSRKFNTIFIPNSSSTTEQSTVLHKSKKFNYICSINPGKLTTLSGSIFDAGSVTSSTTVPSYDSPFNKVPGPNKASRFIAEFVIVARE